MTGGPANSDPESEARRRLIRRATRYTIGFFAAAVVVAVAGAALVAWALSAAGLPFLESWIAISLIVLGVPLIGLAAKTLKGHRQNEPDAGGSGGEDTEDRWRKTGR